jgi:hypothetical protein
MATLDGLKADKMKLEVGILALVRAFELNHGVGVHSVDVIHDHRIGSYTSGTVDIKLDIRI